LLLRLGVSREISAPDIVVPEERNLVGIGPGPTHRWSVEPPCGPESERYKGIDILGDRIIARSDTNHFHDVDPETGEILADWSNDRFVFGSETVTFGGAHVKAIRWFDGKVILKTTDEKLYGFNPDGHQLWDRELQTNWVLNPQDDEFAMWIEPTRGKKMVVRLNTDTGKIVEHLAGSSDAQQYVDE
jgi:outer membrane protein assembly factor BamB